VADLKRSAKMEYSDPHHKRTHFTADSFSSEVDGVERCVVFTGHGLHGSVLLAERGPSVAAIVPELKSELVLWKIQVLERQKWLTLDFEANPLLSRILIHIDQLDPKALASALREVIGPRKLLFHYFEA
jgi:hypothetical protein